MSRLQSCSSAKVNCPLVGIVVGSDSDLPAMADACQLLKQAGVPYEMNVFSAHRTPELLQRYLRSAGQRGVEVFIAAAGGAAHLPGVIASQTIAPVIGVPVDSQLLGFDSLLSIVQMPKGVPVATVAIGKSGAANAAILALQILSLKYPSLVKAVQQIRASLRRRVLLANRRLQQEGIPTEAAKPCAR